MRLLFLVAWLAQSALEIQGESTCPTPAEVSQSLTRLLPAIDAAGLEAAYADLKTNP